MKDFVPSIYELIVIPMGILLLGILLFIFTFNDYLATLTVLNADNWDIVPVPLITLFQFAEESGYIYPYHIPVAVCLGFGAFSIVRFLFHLPDILTEDNQ